MEYLFEHQRIANPDCYHAHRYHLLLLLPTENPTLTDDLIPKDKTHALGDGVAVRVEQPLCLHNDASFLVNHCHRRDFALVLSCHGGVFCIREAHPSQWSDG